MADFIKFNGMWINRDQIRNLDVNATTLTLHCSDTTNLAFTLASNADALAAADLIGRSNATTAPPEVTI